MCKLEQTYMVCMFELMCCAICVCVSVCVSIKVWLPGLLMEGQKYFRFYKKKKKINL